MKQEKQEENKQQILYDRYPEIFRQKDLPMTETCMCWGIDCGDGWFDLLNELCQRLDFVRKKSGIITEASQVKEKYGTLRFYYTTQEGNVKLSDEEFGHWQAIIDALIEEAENKSGHTCEICGEFGSICQRNNWLKTVCAKCAEKDGYKTISRL